MENQRLFLWSILAIILFFMLQAWQADYGPQPKAAIENSENSVIAPSDVDSEKPNTAGLDVGSVETNFTSDNKPKSNTLAGQKIQVSTDVIDLTFDVMGGSLQGLVLKDYPIKKDEPENLVKLFSRNQEETYLLDSGLRASGVSIEPTHQVEWQATQNSYELGNRDTLKVPFNWVSPEGLRVTKTYTFQRGRYDFTIDHAIENATSQPIAVRQYAQLQRDHEPLGRSMVDVDSYSSKLPTWFDGKKYEKLDVDDIEDEPLKEKVKGGWVALIEHHFVAAIIPPKDEDYTIIAKADSDTSYRVTTSSESKTIAPGANLNLHQQFWAGPKIQEDLDKLSPKLSLTTDYGFFSLFSRPLFWMLSKVQKVISNWGWSIIAVTILIKLIFFPLTAKSARSMAKMKKVQPRLKMIQERYKDDRQKLQQEMMALYKKEKINPMAGCLPILIQFPFFLGFYWLLIESVELRQQPWAMWITDLSSRDPLYILPVIYGIVMFFQMRIQPSQGMNPDIQRVMKFMPIAMTVLFAFFPAGLLLYWVTNSIFTVVQQWYINKHLK